jgi:tRNA threonylcarbamoyladenosine biosynthesis protein TsaB
MNNMNSIAIDTSTETLGICFQNKKDQVLCFSLKMGFQHSTLLIPWLEKIIHQAGTSPGELDLVICSSGPGSFTGLRIGLATAKGLATGADCPLTGISSLDAIAYGQKHDPGIVVPVIDARKNRFYTAFYKKGERVSGYGDMTKEALLDNCRRYHDILLTGPGAKIILDAGPTPGNDHAVRLDPGYQLPNPFFLLQAGTEKYLAEKKGDPDTAGPLYIRKSEAEINKKQEK